MNLHFFFVIVYIILRLLRSLKMILCRPQIITLIDYWRPIGLLSLLVNQTLDVPMCRKNKAAICRSPVCSTSVPVSSILGFAAFKYPH